MEIKPEEYSSYLKEEYLSIREAAELLEIGEIELRGLIEKHSIPTHQIAGAFLRLKKKELEELKNKWRIERELFARDGKTFVHGGVAPRKATIFERLSDFWYFNDFYLLCSLVIFVLLYYIVTSQ